MKSFIEYLFNGKNMICESTESDLYEKKIAQQIKAYSVANGLDWTAERPVVGTSYSDVRVIDKDGFTSWIEVKMNITDQLGTPRVFYKNGTWQSNMHTPIAKDICATLQNSQQAKTFLNDLAKFTNIDLKKLYLSPYKSEIAKNNIDEMVTLDQLREYAELHGRYIMKQDYTNLEKVLAKHYLEGKNEPAQYIQIGDNFFLLDHEINPLGFENVPTIKGNGILNVRFTTRSEFYEIQAEIKFKNILPSPVSFKPGSTKPMPEISSSTK